MTSTVTIKTNRHWRNFCYRNEVPADILAREFDWTSEDDHFDGFFQYRGWWYHLDEFESVRGLTEEPLCHWHAYRADSFFSGIVIKLSRDGERFMVGTYLS